MKTAFNELEKSYQTVANELGISKTALVNAVVHGVFPSKNTKQFKANLAEYFIKNGVSVPSILTQTENPKTPISQDKDELMLLRKSTLNPQTRRHFGLAKDPFDDEIRSSDDIFKSDDVRYIRERLYDVASNGGFVAVIGESGAGKSTLREDLHDRLFKDDKATTLIEPYVLAMEDNDIKGKTLKSVHIAEAILEAVAPSEKPKRSPEARFRQIHKALTESHKAGNRHLIVIEEAHGLPIPTLKHLKRFYELKAGFDRLLGIVLIGQTELATKLAENNPTVREVVQRCEIATLEPLTDGKLEGYLKHKFERAGGDIKQILDESALDAISQRLTVKSRTKAGTHEHSLLYPLAVNNLVAHAMNETVYLGFDKVDGDIIKSI